MKHRAFRVEVQLYSKPCLYGKGLKILNWHLGNFYLPFFSFISVVKNTYFYLVMEV